MRNGKAKANGHAAPEALYAEGSEPDPALLAALDDALEHNRAVEYGRDRIVRPAPELIHEAAVLALPNGRGAVLYTRLSRAPLPATGWHPTARMDAKRVGSHDFLFARPFRGELTVRTLAMLEAGFGRTKEQGYLASPLRDGEAAEPVTVEAALVANLTGASDIVHVRWRGLWHSAHVIRKIAARMADAQEARRQLTTYPDVSIV